MKSGYVLSYNGSTKNPNWVSWELNSSYLGSAPRQDDFRSDSTLPVSVAQASLADYSGSGYDRGHMAPSADRTLTVAANSETFYLTNMVPQAGNNNRGPWAQLEDYSRTLVGQGKELFVISGGTYSGSSNAIGNNVQVPDKTWKVIVVLNSTSATVTDVISTTRVIGVLMPNEDSQIGLTDDWRSYRVSVDAIEAATELDLLSDVSATVESVIEARRRQPVATAPRSTSLLGALDLLLDEGERGGEPLEQLGLADQHLLDDALDAVAGGDVGVGGDLAQRLGQAHRDGRVGGEQLGAGSHRAIERVDVGHHVVDQAVALGGGGAEQAAGEDELLGARLADGADEPRGAADVGDDAEGDLGEAEHAIGGGDAHVGRER